MKINKNSVFKIVMVIAVFAFAFFSMSPINQTTGASDIVMENLDAEEVNEDIKPIIQTTIIDDANYVYLTNSDTPVYSQPGGTVIGRLQPGVSITVVPIDEDIEYGGYGWVREFKGWCDLKNLTKVPLNQVIGIAYTGLEGKLCPSYDKLDDSATVTMLQPHSAYTVLPNIYNGKFIKIGDNSYVYATDVIIDWYQKDYYEREVIRPVSRGYVDRYRNSLLKDLNYNITEPSGLTPADFNKITVGTGLDGLGYVFYDIEVENGVNGVFALAVAQLESGHGTSYMARADNNCFGMMGMRFSSKEEGVRYFGKLIQTRYFNKGLTTIESINRVYCPSNSEWSTMVASLMNKNFNKFNN